MMEVINRMDSRPVKNQKMKISKRKFHPKTSLNLIDWPMSSEPLKMIALSFQSELSGSPQPINLDTMINTRDYALRESEILTIISISEPLKVKRRES